MKYKKFATEKEALGFSANECLIRKCGISTKYWYCTREASDGWYAIIHDESKISGAVDSEPTWKPAQISK